MVGLETNAIALYLGAVRHWLKRTLCLIVPLKESQMYSQICMNFTIRKSTSLSKETRETLIELLCESIRLLIRILQKAAGTVSPACRGAFCFHVYMLYSCMFLLESQIKADAITNASQGAPKTDTAIVEQRMRGIETLLAASVAMDEYRTSLWQRGVVDEQVVLIPCKMAYLLLERSTGIVARRTHGAVPAMEILTRTAQAHGSLLTHVVASLWDMLHNHEHAAVMLADLCTVDSNGAYLLVHEMLKEYGRLDGSGDPKMTGIKFVAPWVAHVAEQRPDWVLPHLSHLVGHLTQSEAYPLRSAVVGALSSILLQKPQSTISNTSNVEEPSESDNNEQTEEASQPTIQNTSANLSATTREQIFQYLVVQTHDVSSFTRAAVLKAWGRLVVNGALPKGWIQRVTQIALERLSDKTVAVRKQAMQVRHSQCFLPHITAWYFSHILCCIISF